VITISIGTWRPNSIGFPTLCVTADTGMTAFGSSPLT